MSKETLFVGWQSPVSRKWNTVGKVEHDLENETYTFCYTKGLEGCKSEFTLFSGMDDITKVYYSKRPFPFLENRLLPKRRPEYKEFLSWISDDEEAISPLSELAFSGGIKGTDSLEFFSVPKSTGTGYKYRFFVRGIRHLSDASIERIKQLKQGENIYLMSDPQNAGDKNAVAMRTDKPAMLIGYCPKYFSSDVSKLFQSEECTQSISAKIVKVNHLAPFQYRIAVDLDGRWPKGHLPFKGKDYEPIADFSHPANERPATL